ncbi:MAG: tetratricopeptide repeat protein, partial [Pseudomonadota bacterium]
MGETMPTRTIKLSDLFSAAVERHQKGELEVAAKLYRTYLAAAPGQARGWTNYGALLRKQGHFAAAIAAHRKALQLQPGMENAANNLCNALADAGQFAEAIERREALHAANPDDFNKLRDLTVALRGGWQHARVISTVDQAEARLGVENLGELQLQRALSRLMLGDYAGGFADFEARYHGTEVSLPKEMPFPRWQGEDLAGKRILVMPEQGFGDAILMARFLPRLKAMGADVTLVVKPPLMRLFAELEGVDRLVPSAKKTDAYDFYTPNMSLPHFVGAESWPPPPPKLAIPEEARARAERLIRPFKDWFKVGVIWTGSLTYKANHRRSTAPESFLPLADLPGVQLFS